MILKSTEVQKGYIGFCQYFIKKSINSVKIWISFLAALILFFMLFFASKGLVGNNYSKDMLVANFRTDVNKLYEASAIIESMRMGHPDSGLHEFGSTGKLLNSAETNQNLRRALIKVADINKDSILTEDEINSLGIMSLDENTYFEELRSLQFHNLSIDNNLKHYVVITKGDSAGMVLYNGCLQFIDSNKRCYFGVELFEQLSDLSDLN